jgi:hypothetical protein
MQWLGLIIICCGMTVRIGMLGSEYKEDESTDCEDGDSDTDQ